MTLAIGGGVFWAAPEQAAQVSHVRHETERRHEGGDYTLESGRPEAMGDGVEYLQTDQQDGDINPVTTNSELKIIRRPQKGGAYYDRGAPSARNLIELKDELVGRVQGLQHNGHEECRTDSALINDVLKETPNTDFGASRKSRRGKHRRTLDLSDCDPAYSALSS